MMKLKLQQSLIVLVLALGLYSCSNDDDISDRPAPTISDVEVGFKNNEVGVVGDDFHFNADILAGDLIDLVTVDIVQREEETYSHDWSFEMVWDKYKGLKNAHMHQHFDIPADAAKGVYDYIITVTDQNGTVLEEVREVNLIDAEDYPEVTPYVKVFGVDKVSADGTYGFNNFYNNGEYRDPDNSFFNKDESIWAALEIGSVKGDGIMYALLIKKSANHLPENVESIDFERAIVTETREHYDYNDVQGLKNSNNPDYNNNFLYGAQLKFGAAEDNNLPTANPITDAIAWENGTYYYGVVYTNITYGRSTFKYIEFEVTGF